MSDMNHWVLSGRLQTDPELRHTASGKPVANFALRTAKYIDPENRRVSFIDVAIFGPRAETVAKHFKKGSPIYLRGEGQQEKWTAQDGTSRSKISFVAYDFYFPMKDSGGHFSEEESQTEEMPDAPSDVPF